jgi:hypothetical protein
MTKPWAARQAANDAKANLSAAQALAVTGEAGGPPIAANLLNDHQLSAHSGRRRLSR